MDGPGAGLPLIAMDVDAFLAAASVANEGLTDFGDADFREPLGVLIAAVKDEAELTPEGFYGWQQHVLKLLGNRLRIEALIAEHPEIADQPVARPLIIVSAQRTGSTKLQNVLACDPRWHTPLLWEAMFPAPLAGEQPGDPGARIAATRGWTEMFYAMAPEAMQLHAMAAEAVEEETFAVEMSFRWTVPAVLAMIPSYIRWVETRGCVPTYRDMKRILQVLQWQRGSVKPWLLKSPWHIGFLDDLLEVFPDATIVQCHRDPAESVPSNCALMYLGRRMGRPTLDKAEHGRDVLGMMEREMAAHLAHRDARGPGDWIVDVPYREIVSDAAGVVRRIYAARGEVLPGEVAEAIGAWEAENRQHKHGRFPYTLEEYGLTADAVDAGFRDYKTRFAACLA